jgi:hypothetical protein
MHCLLDGWRGHKTEVRGHSCDPAATQRLLGLNAGAFPKCPHLDLPRRLPPYWKVSRHQKNYWPPKPSSAKKKTPDFIGIVLKTSYAKKTVDPARLWARDWDSGTSNRDSGGRVPQLGASLRRPSLGRKTARSRARGSDSQAAPRAFGSQPQALAVGLGRLRHVICIFPGTQGGL